MAIGPPSSVRSGPSPQPPVRHANRVFDGPAGRILCVADIRGQHSQLNQLAQETNARAIIHTGDFGFFDKSSFESSNISEKTLRHLLTYSPLISPEQRDSFTSKNVSIDEIRQTLRNTPTHLSEFTLLLSGKLKLIVPVYTVWGACEDVSVLEKVRAGEYDNIENLHVIDEATSRSLEIGGIKLRLLGLGGAYVPHKLFDNGDGHATIAGGQGTMWTTALQVGELVDTAQKSFDQSETRLLVTHASPGREGLLAQLGTAVKADLTISAALHFRYSSSWNEFSVQQDVDAYRSKLEKGKNDFEKVWNTVKSQVEPAVDDHQKILLEKALSLITKPPSTSAPAAEDAQWKNTWNWNLCDAAFGYLVLDIREGRVSAELKSQGFNYAYRRTAAPASANNAAVSTPASALNRLPSAVASPAAQASPALPSAAPLAPPPTQAATNGISLASAEPSPAPTPAPAEPPVPSTNGVNGTSATENLTSPKQHKKKLSNAERRERKAEREKPNGSEAERPGSKPSSPIPTSSSPVPRGQQRNLRGTPKSNASPALSADRGLPESDAAPSPSVTSPLVRDAATLGGMRSPVPGAKKARNPWTLFVNKLPVPVSEEELRDVFGEHKGTITFVKLMFGPGKVQKQTAFVEFGDEESMNVALHNNSGKIKDRYIEIAVAKNRNGPEDSNAVSDTGAASDTANGPFVGAGRGGGSMRGPRGGRGGRGGGALFAQAMGQSLGRGGQGPRRSSGAGNEAK